MPRDPFVWEVQVRREVLDEEVARLRELPYSVWREMLSRTMTKSVLGRDNRPYNLHVTARTTPRSEDIRVTITLKSSGLRRTRMRESFVITPDNRFRQ